MRASQEVGEEEEKEEGEGELKDWPELETTGEVRDRRRWSVDLRERHFRRAGLSPLGLALLRPQANQAARGLSHLFSNETVRPRWQSNLLPLSIVVNARSFPRRSLAHKHELEPDGP